MGDEWGGSNAGGVLDDLAVLCCALLDSENEWQEKRLSFRFEKRS